MIKKCRICGNEFETIKNGGSRQFCFICVPQGLSENDRTIAKRRAIKEQGVKILGGKCCKCGECRSHVLAFHHLNPIEKDDAPSRMIANSQVENFFNEIKKCILLCQNCHTDFHFLESHNNISIQDYLGNNYNNAIQWTINYEDNIDREYIKKEYKCAICGKEISKGATLCIECNKKSQRICERPAREELKNLIRIMPFTQIGKLYNVSDKAITKWCKTENLPYRKKDINTYSDEEWENI